MTITKKAKRIFLVIALLETSIILGLAVFMVLRNKKVIVFSGDELIANSTLYVAISPGSYNITLAYYPKSIDPAVENGPWHIKDGDKEESPRGLCGQLEGYMDFETTEITIPIWLYYSTNELWVYNECPVQMQSISIVETNAMFKENLLYLFIGFILVDFLIARIYISKFGGKKEKETNIIVVSIIATTILLSIPLMFNYLLNGHDIIFHLTRIEGIKYGILNRSLPVRINRYALDGQGYADPIFYPQLFLYIPAIFRIIGIPMYRSYKLFLVLVNLMGCIIAYISFNQITHKTRSSILGMILYNLAPYHLACLYSRSAIGEAQAYSFLPLVMAGCFLLISQENETKVLYKGVMALTFGLTGMIQSHILSCEMTGLFMILTVIICFKRVFRLKTFLSFLIAGILTLALNAWFLIPFLQSFGMDLYAFKELDVRILTERLSICQLIGLLPGKQLIDLGLGSEVAEKTGITLGLAIVLSLFVAYIYTFIKKIKDKKDFKRVLIVGVLGIISSWITTYLFPWKYVMSIPFLGWLLKTVQFPWRYLGISCIFFTTSIVLLLAMWKKEYSKIFKQIFAIVVVVLSVLLCVFQLFGYFSGDKKTLKPYNDIGKGRAISQAEYLYVGTDIYTIESGKNVDSQFYPDKDALVFQVNNNTADVLKVDTPLTYYPYYVAIGKDNKISMNVGKNDTGTAYFEVPAGFSGDVKFYVPEKISWIIGDIVSLLAAFMLLGYCLKSKIKEKNSDREVA